MEEETKKKTEAKKSISEASKRTGIICNDRKCPFHGNLAARGRSFKGHVTKLPYKRAVIEFERFIFIKKYERYMRKKTRIHAHLPDCLADNVRVGSYVKVMECRPLSKIIHHVVVGLIEESQKSEAVDESKTPAGAKK